MIKFSRVHLLFLATLLLGGALGYVTNASPGPLNVSPASPSPSATVATAIASARIIVPTAMPSPTATPQPTSTLVPTATPTRVPTMTSTPMPTPTPRIKPPPSAYRRLQDYPRPVNDSGYGFHINVSPYPPDRDVMVNQVIPLLKELGATWVTVWAADENQVDKIKPLVDNGIEVVLRFHPVNAKPHPNYVPPKEYIAKFVAAGIHYFVAGNEPNLNQENEGGGPEVIARQWMMASDNIKAAGGIPLLYPMSPGGDQYHRDMLEGIMKWLKANDALDTLDGAGVAIHNRPHNKPLDFRDDTSFLEYEWIDDLVVRYFGRSIPIIGTEAGYTVGEDRDRRFPKIDPAMHKAYNMGIIEGFRDGRWRDSLFAENFWVLGEFGYRAGQFIADPWIFNPLNNGKDLPIVAALKAMPKFVRKFQGEGFQTRTSGP